MPERLSRRSFLRFAAAAGGLGGLAATGMNLPPSNNQISAQIGPSIAEPLVAGDPNFARLGGIVPAPDFPEFGEEVDGLPNPIEAREGLDEFPGINTPDKVEGDDPGFYETSVFLAGHVAVNVLFAESANGPENWTDAERGSAINSLQSAFALWQNEVNSKFPDAKLRFSIVNHGLAATKGEMILTPSSLHGEAIEAMGRAKGGVGANAHDVMFSLNNNARDALNADWAYTIILVDTTPTNRRFPDRGAYAYIGGPVAVIPTEAGGSITSGRVVHEGMHVFGALDQYPGAKVPCHETSGYFKAETQNSEQPGCKLNHPSVMRATGTTAIDPSAAEQAGLQMIGFLLNAGMLQTEFAIHSKGDGTYRVDLDMSTTPPTPGAGNRPIVGRRIREIRYFQFGKPAQVISINESDQKARVRTSVTVPSNKGRMEIVSSYGHNGEVVLGDDGGNIYMPLVQR